MSKTEFRSDGLPARLREARERAGLTQSEVSRRAGLSRMTCSDIEGGRRMGNIGVRTIELLAEVLGVSPCWLAFGGERM